MGVQNKIDFLSLSYTRHAEDVRETRNFLSRLDDLSQTQIFATFENVEVDDRFCIYLEYIHPGSLNKYLRDYGGALPESVVGNFTRHIVSGIAYLHNTKTIHRDIKGTNLLVDASGVVKLAGFGLAKHLSKKNLIFHWPLSRYMELGYTVIEMFTGQPPWSDLSWMFGVSNKSPPIPETLSSEGKHFIGCLLQRNPADRPSAAMLLDHLAFPF